jgi:hypothetical protein
MEKNDTPDPVTPYTTKLALRPIHSTLRRDHRSVTVGKPSHANARRRAENSALAFVNIVQTRLTVQLLDRHDRV